MRAGYQEELAAISDGLVRMARLAGSAMGRATTALLDADLQLAESVIAADETLDQLRQEVEARAIAVLEHEHPVGGELRMVVTALRTSASLERAGDLAQHVAKLARLRYPDAVVPHDLHTTVLEMGQLAQRLMAKTAEVLATGDAKAAAQVEAEDDQMDDLHRVLFQHLMDQHWQHGVETAVDVTLAGRFYERFADHAVTAADRVARLAETDRPDAPTVAPDIRRFLPSQAAGGSGRSRRRAWGWPGQRRAR
jgi:phosphate transport system protein